MFEGDNSGLGESMGVVTDKLMEELRTELDLIKTTWVQPNIHASSLQDLAQATAAMEALQVSVPRAWNPSPIPPV